MTPMDAAAAEYRALRDWLFGAALPRWARQGYDSLRGGFEESLTESGAPPGQARRARVQVRQIFTFARAARLGWDAAAAARLVSGGLDYFLTRYRRPDGLFRTLVGVDGAVLDDRAFLYDQAFVLLALAEAREREAALALRAAMRQQLARPGGGYSSGLPQALPLLSNPHMHLLEAALSWIAAGADEEWRLLADQLVALALERFIDRHSGALREQFDQQWRPLAGIPGRIVEPGHQFEWAWLLLCWSGNRQAPAYRAALRLAEIGEKHGIRSGVAINALLDDFSVHDPEARLWPQTERLKAAARLAAMTAETPYWTFAGEAARGLRRYLRIDAPGLWHDRLLPDGQFAAQPAPASSFYHIICAIEELGAALQAAARRPDAANAGPH